MGEGKPTPVQNRGNTLAPSLHLLSLCCHTETDPSGLCRLPGTCANILLRSLENTKCSENDLLVLGQMITHSREHTHHGGACSGPRGCGNSSPTPVHLPQNSPRCVTVLWISLSFLPVSRTEVSNVERAPGDPTTV